MLEKSSRQFLFSEQPCEQKSLDVISDQTCIIGNLEYLWNKKRYQKKKNAVLLYFEKPFKWVYFLNDIFFGSYAL